MKKTPLCVDLRKLTEDEQIRVLGSTASTGKRIGFTLTANNTAKKARFLSELARLFPECKVEEIGLLPSGALGFTIERRQN